MSLDTLRVGSLPQRPGSSLSQISVSRTSQKLLSQRSKHSRLTPLLSTLVKQITGLTSENDSEDFQEAIGKASKRIDQTRRAVIPDLTKIDVHVRGHIRKARINMQDNLADLLQRKYAELKFNVAQHKDLDDEIKLSTLSHHLEFLLLLSSPPTPMTFSQAELILTRDKAEAHSPSLTWRKILQEDPLEGQHWQGVLGLPGDSVVGSWEANSDTSDVFSSLESSDSLGDSISSAEDVSCQPSPRKILQEQYRKPSSKHGGRGLVENLQAGQYWKSGWRTHTDLRGEFDIDIGDPSTLGPATSRILLRDAAPFADLQEAYINEVDAVREVLIALQGRESCLFQIGTIDDVHHVTVFQYRRMLHFTHTSLASVLDTFALYASTLNPLRAFVCRTWEQGLSSSSSMTPCRTFEAFSAAIDRQLALFDQWCSGQEQCINSCGNGEASPNHVVSLLGLEKEVGNKLAGTFQTLLHIALSVEKRQDQDSPSVLSAFIMNALLEAVRDHSTNGDVITARCLVDVWRESAEPLWSNIGQWLRDGIPIRTGFEGETYATDPTWDEKEFFIRINHLVDPASPEFWESGYTLHLCHQNQLSTRQDARDDVVESSVPKFLQGFAEDILAAGKAIGHLRALNMMSLVGDDWLEGWSSFGKLTEVLSLWGFDEMLENLISDVLISPCRHAQLCLRQVLVNECNLWKHVQSSENVYFMMRGDAMSHFGEKLFARMDTGQPWNDFHFLNSSFQEVTTYGSIPWINPSLVRISHRGAKDRNISRTVRGIDGLSIEYAFPFPLTYLFGLDTNASYSSIFTFLLQIKRAKSVMDGILIRGLNSSVLSRDLLSLKAFYALRSKLSWFLNILVDFIMTNVIHVGLMEFHKTLSRAGSLDEMILIHRSHLERLLSQCLLHESTSALHRAILSILDISLHFNDCLAAFAGDTSLDISRRSLHAMRHRRRRAAGRLKPDVIGFADGLPLSDVDTGSEEDDHEETAEPSTSGAASISFAEESFSARLERMNAELDGLLRFLRHGVESLASGYAAVRREVAATFGVFAFALDHPTL